MSKKRKLNSKNPKYMDKSLVTEKKVIRKELINNVNGVKINAIWYEKQNNELFNSIRL